MTLLLAATFLLVVGLVGATVSATPTGECAYTNYRLPKHILPKHYNLDLNVDTQKHECRGQVIIDIEVKRNEDEQVPNDIIVLHANPDITIISVEYKEIGAEPSSRRLKRLKAEVGFCRYSLNELLVVNLEKDLAEHTRAELTVSFSAKIRADHTGIYKTGNVISTDFKPDRARRAFPCFDEPSFKATFDISLTHDSEKVAQANTALVYEEKLFGRKFSKFARTPPMSTYLVAFVVGELDHIEMEVPDRDLTIRAFTRVGKSEQARFALETAVSAIKYMEEYFDTPFPLKKLDMLSGVELYSGARENWGLIAFTDYLFLCDEATTSPISRAHIARAVIHQLALQWFGNLVTMRWWNDLWLTEGFAGLMELNVTEHLYPKLQVELYHLTETHQNVLNFDSRGNIRSIRVPDVGRNIEEYFDEMVNHKSVEVIRLLHDAYLKPERFKLGMRRHISQYRLEVADANDLWKDMMEYSKLPVNEFIESWTKQSGHPLVEVQIVRAHERKLSVRQRRDRSSRWSVVSSQEEGEETWIIPVTVRVSDDAGFDEVQTYYLDKPQMEVDLPGWFKFRRGPTHWLKVNENSRGFYRVDYGGIILQQRLEEPCRTRKLSKNDKIGLINDARVHFQNNPKTFAKFRDMLEWFKGEMDGSVLGELARSYSLFSPSVPLGVGLGQELFATAYHEFGLRNELFQNVRLPDSMGAMDIEGLIKAYEKLLELNYSSFVEEALRKFDTDRNTVVSGIRGVVYETVALRGSPEQLGILEFLLYHNDNDQEEINRIIAALRLVPDSMKSHLLRSY